MCLNMLLLQKKIENWKRHSQTNTDNDFSGAFCLLHKIQTGPFSKSWHQSVSWFGRCFIKPEFVMIIIRVSPFQLHCPAPALLSTVLFSKLSHHISRVEDYYSGRAPTLLRPTATSTRFSSRFIEYAKLSFFQLCLKIRGGWRIFNKFYTLLKKET